MDPRNPFESAEDLAQARGEYDLQSDEAYDMAELADRARRSLDGWREPDEYLRDLLAAAYAAYLVHSGSAIVERRP